MTSSRCYAAQSRAQQLRALGAEVVAADNHDLDSLEAALEGAHGVYAITTWSGSSFAADGTVVRSDNLDPVHLEESEVAQGINILRAAERTPSLQHYVLQSMHRGGREQPVDASVVAPLHHRAKWRQEKALQHAALPCAWSILRQPTYLENFANDATAAKGTLLRQIRPGVVSGLLKPDEQFTVIAVDDLGALAVGMLRRGPEEFASRVRRSGDSNRQNNQQRPSGVPWPLLFSRLAPGQTLAAGTERISGRSLAAAASRVHGGASFAYKQVPWFVLEYFIPVDYPKQLQRWLSLGLNDEGARPEHADERRACRELHPDMLSVEDWLRRQGVAELPAPLPQRLAASVRASLAPLLAATAPRAAAPSMLRPSPAAAPRAAAAPAAAPVGRRLAVGGLLSAIAANTMPVASVFANNAAPPRLARRKRAKSDARARRRADQPTAAPPPRA